jgi:hypothetical protein
MPSFIKQTMASSFPFLRLTNPALIGKESCAEFVRQIKAEEDDASCLLYKRWHLIPVCFIKDGILFLFTS